MAIAAICAVAAPAVNAASLGYGIFLGTWLTKPGNGDSNQNPTPSNAELIGSLILNDPQLPGTAAGAFTPDPFLLSEFVVAGAKEFPGSNLNAVLVFGGSGTDGTWTYNGTSGDQVPGNNPGQDPIDLYIAVKYSKYASIFYYGNVNPGDEGTITSDGANLTSANLDLTLPGYGGAYAFSYGACNPAVINSNDPRYCMPYNPSNTSAHGISHVTGYWPPGDAPVVPLPPAILLLATAFAGLVGVGRLRTVLKG